jgi:hypothetical protein
MEAIPSSTRDYVIIVYIRLWIMRFWEYIWVVYRTVFRNKNITLTITAMTSNLFLMFDYYTFTITDRTSLGTHKESI